MILQSENLVIIDGGADFIFEDYRDDNSHKEGERSKTAECE